MRRALRLTMVSLALVALGAGGLRTPAGAAVGDQPSPTVIYTVRLVELNADLVRKVNASVALSHPDRAGEWSLSGDDDALGLVGTLPKADLTAMLDRGTETKTWSAGYSAWLATVPGETGLVSIREEEILRDPVYATRKERSRLELALTPERVGAAGEDGGVPTELSLKYADSAGAASDLHSSVVVGREAKRPAAIVAQEVLRKERKARRYFALYVSAEVIPASFLPETPVVPIGSVRGLQAFLTPPVEVAPSTWSVSAGCGGAEAQARLAYSHRPRGAGAVTVALQGDARRWSGEIGFAHEVFEGIGAEGRWSGTLDRPGGEATVALSDQVQLLHNLEVQVRFIPGWLDLAQGNVTVLPRYEGAVRWVRGAGVSWQAEVHRWIGDEQVWLLGALIQTD